MKLQLIAIKDKKADAITVVSTAPNIEIAIRNFREICMNQNSPINMWPEDFVLMTIGEVETKTAEISAIKPLVIAEAKQFVESKYDQKTKKEKKK